MNLTEQDKEDITDMIIESRDVGEELNVVAKDSNIEIIEDFINEIKDFELNKDVVEIVNALEDILEEREADKKRIKELEEEREIVGMSVKNKRDGSIGVVLHQWNSGSIAVLENINPRVINTHDSWSTLEIITDEVKQIQTKDDSIPKQKVKDKIKELKEKLTHYDEYTRLNLLEKVNVDLLDARIENLEELLEEK